MINEHQKGRIVCGLPRQSTWKAWWVPPRTIQPVAKQISEYPGYSRRIRHKNRILSILQVPNDLGAPKSETPCPSTESKDKVLCQSKAMTGLSADWPFVVIEDAVALLGSGSVTLVRGWHDFGGCMILNVISFLDPYRSLLIIFSFHDFIQLLEFLHPKILNHN